MGIPRKGSRTIEVDGVRYRYLIRSDGPFVENHNGIPQREFLLATVQKDEDNPGRVAQWRWPSGWGFGPGDVSKCIREALSAGWDPSQKGSAFILE